MEQDTDLVSLPYSKFKWEERAKDHRYVSYHAGGIVIEFHPQPNRHGHSWFSYQFNGLDFFGLGQYGSNQDVQTPEMLDHEIESIIDKYLQKSSEAIEASKVASRTWEVGHKYMVRFTASGVFHHGTYFESFHDIEWWLKILNCYGQDFTAKVFSTPNGEPDDYLGQYEVKQQGNSRKITYTRTVTETREVK